MTPCHATLSDSGMIGNLEVTIYAHPINWSGFRFSRPSIHPSIPSVPVCCSHPVSAGQPTFTAPSHAYSTKVRSCIHGRKHPWEGRYCTSDRCSGKEKSGTRRVRLSRREHYIHYEPALSVFRSYGKKIIPAFPILSLRQSLVPSPAAHKACSHHCSTS